MIIEATTRIDFEAYRRFYLFSLMKSKKTAWQMPLLIGLPPALALAFLIFFFRDTTNLMNLVGFVLMLFSTVVMGAMVTLVPRRYYGVIEKQMMTPNHYQFYNDHLDLTVDQPGLEPLTYTYDKLVKVHQTEGYFYLDLGPGSICIIGNNHFTAGTPEDLRELMADKLGDRFIDHRRGKRA